MPKETSNYPAVYRQSRDYAREHGEIAQCRDSFRQNIACKKAIEASVQEHFDGMHLSDDALKPVLEQFGAERTAYVLANTIQEKSWDGRFTHKNKEWAAAIPVAPNMAFGENRNYEFVVDSHPAILDGFVSMFRKELQKQQTKGRDSVLAQLSTLKGTTPASMKENGKVHREEAR
jgi:hypothetical protein